MNFPNSTKCPKCEQEVKNVYYEVIDAVDPHSGQVGYQVTVYSCPNEFCRAVLSVEVTNNKSFKLQTVFVIPASSPT
jgi:hypothetical protein